MRFSHIPPVYDFGTVFMPKIWRIRIMQSQAFPNNRIQSFAHEIDLTNSNHASHTMSDSRVHIGTAGWSWIVDLKMYAKLFKSVEINTSFYGVPKLETFEKWANSVPNDFTFSVKLFQGFTHTHRLANVTGLDDFINRMSMLGNKLGPLLIQLPPSLEFNSKIAAKFFSTLRERFSGDIVFEPRHLSWFAQPVENLLIDYKIARVAADPWRVEQASKPGGWQSIVYYRLHGSPVIYVSGYTQEFLQALAPKLSDAANSAQVWCIFDNAAENAFKNATDLIKLVQKKQVADRQGTVGRVINSEKKTHNSAQPNQRSRQAC